MYESVYAKELFMGRTMTRKILEQKIGRCIETGQVYFSPWTAP